MDPELAALQEDSNSLAPAVLAVLAAAAAFSATGKVLSGSLKSIALAVGLPALVGAALSAIAQRAIMRHIDAARSQTIRNALLEVTEVAVEKAVEDGYVTLVQAFQHVVDTQRRQAARPVEKLPTSQPGEMFDDVDEVPKTAPHFEDPDLLTRRAAQTVKNAAPYYAAEAIAVVAEEVPVPPESGPGSGIVFRKIWNSKKDNRVRASHAFLGSPKYEYHVVPVLDPFITITGDQIRYPGDPLAPISETARCRCHLTFRAGVSTAG